jgi:hypothetical protein
MTPLPQPSQPPPPPRFTLAGLFELIAGIGLVLALVSEFGGVGVLIVNVAAIIVLTADYVILRRHRDAASQSVEVGCLWFLLGCLLLTCCIPLDWARDSNRASQCQFNIRVIALGLRTYHEQHGHFPPPYVADANGKPMHSWRVLILPYIEEQALYNAYNFNEPWDGPNNSKLASQMPRVFGCPSVGPASSGLTNYFYVVGPGRVPRDSTYQKLSDFKEPTILLVESSDATINWLEPRDLTVAQVLQGSNAGPGPSASSHHSHKGVITRDEGWFHVAMHDASIRRLPQDIDRETLRALLTIDGGETVFHIPKAGERVRPEFWVLISLTVAFVVLTIVRRMRLARRMREGERGASAP